jgi:energy-coupling factor transporter ATP-binding protein EcfA2
MRNLADDGNTVLVASHDPELVAAADHVVSIRDGAVQSETRAGVEHAMVDSAGRVQLPPEVLGWFPDRRVEVDIDARNHEIRLRRP